MEQACRIYSVHCLSPLHVGSGEGVGVIDLPIMREKVTEWPFIPGSSMKGAQRDHYTAIRKSDAWLELAFGKSESKEALAGALVVSDAKILAFPVASRYGIFAYVTCPSVISRFSRDAAAAGKGGAKIPGLAELLKLQPQESQAYTCKGSSVVSEDKLIYLDEFEGDAVSNDSLDLWAEWAADRIFKTDETDNSKQEVVVFKQRLVLVSDDTFQYFVTLCCEVAPRIRILPETKTTQDGAFWYEEYVPTEAIFYGIVWSDRVSGSSDLTARKDLLKALDERQILQIGGNATTGKGRVSCRFWEV
ncbi:type III-B CRISPR module RAMP protein Cmr4 [Bacillus sp. FJAT-27264]|nr:type III-B CRISPR module RAMP protein Cmr4 [Bacillus sp. FJAT-27264]